VRSRVDALDIDYEARAVAHLDAEICDEGIFVEGANVRGAVRLTRIEPRARASCGRAEKRLSMTIGTA
jgi:hypothetical protein